jgi:lactoylglutathione lyase
MTPDSDSEYRKPCLFPPRRDGAFCCIDGENVEMTGPAAGGFPESGPMAFAVGPSLFIYIHMLYWYIQLFLCLTRRVDMKFAFNHNNFNVLDLKKSIAFYEEALGLQVVGQYKAPDGSFILAYLGDGETKHRLELTWLRDRKEPYNLGDNEFHLAFDTDDMEAAHEKHKKMGCICYENPAMGIYFINDPDGYWIEIIPGGK